MRHPHRSDFTYMRHGLQLATWASTMRSDALYKAFQSSASGVAFHAGRAASHCPRAPSPVVLSPS